MSTSTSSPSLRQLEYLVAVAEVGHFGRAAERCGVSQPALSKQVMEVESLLGLQLFERARPRILVTADGEPIIEHARRVLSAAEELVQRASELRGEPQGRLRFAAIPTVGPYVLPGLLARMRTEFPGLMVIAEELQTDDMLAALHGGRVELGLLALPVDDDRLDGVSLYDEPFLVAAPTGHVLDLDTPAMTAQLEGESLLLMDEGHCFRDHALEVCALAGAEPYAELRAGSMSTLVRLVESGLGATLLPVSALRYELGGVGGVTIRAFEENVPFRRIGLRWRSTSPRAGLYRQIGELIRQHVSQMALSDRVEVSGRQPRIELV